MVELHMKCGSLFLLIITKKGVVFYNNMMKFSFVIAGKIWL